MARHTLYLTEIPEPGTSILIEGDEAKHAIRVKRVAAGDLIALTDGRGLTALANVTDARRTLTLTVRTTDHAARTSPSVRVLTASPKGPRLEKMIDALSQVGAASWGALGTKLGVVDPGENKLDRAERVALESAKQCGRAWIMEIGRKASLKDALRGGGAVVVADASGEPYESNGNDEITLLIGPEGGWTEDELASARDAGARVNSFGVHTMRIEVAAPVACACIIDREQRN